MRLSIMWEDKDASFLGLIYFSLFNFAEGVGARVEAINSAGMLLYFFFFNFCFYSFEVWGVT